MMCRLLTKLLFLLALAGLSQPLTAQNVLLTESGNTSQTSAVDDIVAAAKKGGMNVIVIEAGADTHMPGHLEDVHEDSAVFSATRLMKYQSSALEIRSIVKEKIKTLPQSLASVSNQLKAKSPNGEYDPYFHLLYWTLLLLMVGALFENKVFFPFFAGRWWMRQLKTDPVGYSEKLPILIKRAALRILGVGVSMGVAFLIGSLIFRSTPPESLQYSIAIVYITYAACRLAPIVWRLILAPRLCQYRIPHFSNQDALKLYNWLWLTATFNIIFFMFSVWIDELGGNCDVNAFLASVFGFFIAVQNIALVIFNRRSIARALRNGKSMIESSFPIRILSHLWFPVSVIYFIYSWLEMAYRLALDKELSAPLIAGAYFILIAVLIVYGLINFVIERLFQRKRLITLEDEEDSSENAGDDASINIDTAPLSEDDPQTDAMMLRHPLATYEDLARRVAGILAVIAGFWALTRIWDVSSNMMDDTYFDRSLDVIAILFIGYIIYHIVRIWIDNKIEEEGGEMVALAPGDEGGATGASRLATLLPLFRNFMLTVVAVSVIFSALLEFGINVSPLFAGAGVVGLAIGFGAQTLVRDIFSGAFYLFDDAFRKGEYVDIGNVKGTVEKISVRSFQLRHHLGPLHTIPFGEIQFLTNFSRDWVLMKLPLRLTYDTDIERVRKLIKKLGIQLMEDPIIGHTFLQPLKSQGVIEMQDSAMIIRVKFMTKPGDQWAIRKRVYQDIRDLFEREGIKFAHREVTVRLAGEGADDMTEVQKQAVAAAAIQDDAEEEKTQDTGDDR